MKPLAEFSMTYSDSLCYFSVSSSPVLERMPSSLAEVIHLSLHPFRHLSSPHRAAFNLPHHCPNDPSDRRTQKTFCLSSSSQTPGLLWLLLFLSVGSQQGRQQRTEPGSTAQTQRAGLATPHLTPPPHTHTQPDLSLLTSDTHWSLPEAQPHVNAHGRPSGPLFLGMSILPPLAPLQRQPRAQLLADSPLPKHNTCSSWESNHS